MRFFLCCLILVASCSPKPGAHILSKQLPLNDTSFVLVLKLTSDFENDGFKVGAIKSVDNGFTTNCTFYEIIDGLKQLARKNGANLIKITRHEYPDKISTCERIWADIYKVPEVRKHETEIIWERNRKLTWADFKGNPAIFPKSDFTAVSACDFKIESNRLTVFKKPKFFTVTVFDCYTSWIKPGGVGNKELLEHEQCHFDIAELYRRKLQQQLEAADLNSGNLIKESRWIIKDVAKSYNHRNSRYDDETVHGLDKTKQNQWRQMITEELNALHAYEPR